MKQNNKFKLGGFYKHIFDDYYIVVDGLCDMLVDEDAKFDCEKIKVAYISVWNNDVGHMGMLVDSGNRYGSVNMRKFVRIREENGREYFVLDVAGCNHHFYPDEVR